MLNEKRSFYYYCQSYCFIITIFSSNNSYETFMVETEIQASVNVLSVHG